MKLTSNAVLDLLCMKFLNNTMLFSGCQNYFVLRAHS